MRIIASIIVMIEEVTRRNESLQWVCPAFTVCLVYTTLADKLWKPFKLLIFSPLVSAAFFVILYLLICIFYIPLWILSFLITSTGSTLILFGMMFLTMRFLGRSIAFPGSTNNVQREISSDYFRKLIQKIEYLGNMISNFCAAMIAYTAGKF